MEYCAPRGIPHSVFLSWEPSDQDKALAWARLNRATCKGCGTRPDEWDESRGGDRDAYHVDEYTCPGCFELGQHAEQAGNSNRKPPPGTRAVLTPNTRR